MMASEQIEDALAAFVRSKQKGTDSGNYQRNARRAIEEWIDWLADREVPIESSTNYRSHRYVSTPVT